MQFIVFNSIKTSFKIPKSPYNDNTFNFTPHNVKGLEEAFRILASNYTLTHNLNIPRTIRISRKNKDLKPLLAIQNYLILDIDCRTKEDVQKNLDYFKGYTCILGESRTFKEGSYGIKGILKIQPSNDIEYFKIFKKIQGDIRDFGVLDERILSPYHFIYPIEKLKILQLSKGLNFKHTEFTENSTVVEDTELKSNDYNDMCLEYFKHLGFKKISSLEYVFNNKTYKHIRPYLMSSGIDSVNIYEQIEGIQSQKIKNFIQKYTPNLTINCEFLTKYNLKFNFKDYNALAIKSYMGSKKSEIIKKIIQTKSKVLVVTPRISLALEYNNKFKLPVYLNVNFKKTDDYYKTNYKKGDSLICQYDSLHKINPKDFDYVVMDEYVSILLHSIDNLSKLKKENLIKFKSLFNKKLIISDAFLNDYLMDSLVNGKIFKIENTYKMDVNFIEHRTKQDFLNSILESISRGEKISISTNSVNLIYNDILKLTEGLDKSIAVIEGQDQETKKKESIKNLNSHYLNSDIIIYSPAITVGVSIFNNITRHFHYDGSNSIDTIQSIQMLGRTRLTRDIEYFVQGKQQYLRLGKENEEWEIKNRHKNSDNSFYFDLDENGDIILSGLGKFYLGIKMFLRFLKFNTLESFKLLLGCNYKF